MIRSIPKPDDRDEWLEARHGYFNASDAAALLDRHPFVTLTSIVEAKLRPDPTDHGENHHMRRGRHLEPAIAAWWEDEHGVMLYEPSIMYANGSCLATLDRRYAGVDDRAVEIKTTAKTIAEPERYWLDQVQLQMHCSDLAVVDIVAVDSSMTLQHFEVQRDDELIAQLTERAEHVMEAVRAGRWPDGVPTPSEARPERQSGLVCALDDDTAHLVDELATVREQIRSLRDDEDHLRRLVVQRLGDATTGEHEGRVIVRNAITSRRSLDTKRLRDDHPALVEDYEQTKRIASLRIVS